MNLERSAEKKYDHVVSLGGYCQTAYQLRRGGLRNESYPFDWLVCEDHAMFCECIKSDFSGWMNRENIEEIPPRAPGHRTVIDRRYGFVHQHVFPQDKSIEEAYPEVMETYDRRIKRFLELKGKNVLFVRTRMTVQESEELFNIIQNMYGDGADLLVVNHTYEHEMKKELLNPRLTIYTVYDEDRHTGQRWKGYNKHWNRILRDIEGADYMKLMLRGIWLRMRVKLKEDVQ